MITPRQNESLTCIPTEAEIKSAIFGLSPDSAPGPDGFGEKFFQVSWEIIKFDIINVVGFFFTSTLIPAGLNSNIVTLILKKIGASRVEEFRPIVLGNFLFKIFTKIISMRLGPILKLLLSPTQYGFIPGKNIHHCIAVGSEGFYCLSKGEGNMALKVVIRKAFDTMQ